MHSMLFLPTIYLLAAVIAVPLASRLGLGSVLGYLSAGVLIGLMPGLGEETRDLQHFAEFGVVMMLFIIGLELTPGALWAMRQRLVGLGGVQVVLTCMVFFVASSLFGLAWQTSLAIGLVLSLSSTAIVLQTLTEKRPCADIRRALCLCGLVDAGHCRDPVSGADTAFERCCACCLWA